MSGWKAARDASGHLLVTSMCLTGTCAFIALSIRVLAWGLGR